jgi:hypothetical protein
MQLCHGPLPDAEDFHPAEDPRWTLIKEPQVGMAQLLGMVVSAILAVPLWMAFPDSPGPADVPSWSSYVVVNLVLICIAMPISILVHELIHMLFHPGAGTRRGSVLGYWPAHFMFYAAWSGEWSRERFVVCLLAPTVVITGLLLLLQHIHPIAATPILACIHLVGCGGDLVYTALLLRTTPAGATMRNKCWDTYWRSAPKMR